MSATPRISSGGPPVLAFTCGDPAGIGPRAVVLALREPRLKRSCRPLLVGETQVWRRAGLRPGEFPLMDTGLGIEPPRPGRASAAGGRLSFAALRLAVTLAGRRLVAGIVTAPISKTSWDSAGVPFRDHTEFLRRETRHSGQMILGAPNHGLWCALATRHIPLSRVPAELASGRILEAARALDLALRRLGLRRPRLGLCGLNPHAGEGGLLGLEEERVLTPAVLRARRMRFDLRGPIPADTAWRWQREGRLDGLVCLYHDQALIPLKAAAGLEVVNWTAGLPFVRTSPGHGTAFDAAGSQAPIDPSAIVAAAELAARLALDN